MISFFEKSHRTENKHKVVGLFLVGAFLGKSAQLLQWLVFFRQTTISLWLGHFSYNRNYQNYYHKAKFGQRKLVQKGPPFKFFIFCNRIYVNKA